MISSCFFLGLGQECVFPPTWVMIWLCVTAAAVYGYTAWKDKLVRRTYTLKAVNILLLAVGFALFSLGVDPLVGRSVLRVLVALLILQDVIINLDILLWPPRWVLAKIRGESIGEPPAI